MSLWRRPLFGQEWPHYAIVAHIILWLTSAIFLASCVGAFAGLLNPQSAVIMLVIWIAAGMLMGAAALCSGMVYIGNQVFSRKPTIGWPARLAGAFLFVGTVVLLFLGYAITHIRGV